MRSAVTKSTHARQRSQGSAPDSTSAARRPKDADTAPLPDPETQDDALATAEREWAERLEWLEATIGRLTESVRTMKMNPPVTDSLVTKLIDLLPDERRHVEALVESLVDRGDVECSECGRNVARTGVARHLVICRGGAYEDRQPDAVERPEYNDALHRLVEALAAAGLDNGLALDLETEGNARLFDALDQEREGVLAAVSRIVGSG